MNRKKTISILSNIRAILVMALMFPVLAGYGQWVNQKGFGNEWIDFSKEYVSVQVTHTGIQRLKISDLPSPLKETAPDKFQLWYRGREVSILEANKDEILFYGVTNDGASDSLLYRPFTARLNPHVSLFSDKGYYFLTHSAQPAKRAGQIDATALPSAGAAPISNQIGKEIKAFNDQFSFPTFSTSTLLNNSFYEGSNTWTGPTIAGDSTTSVKETQAILKAALVNFIPQAGLLPQIELLVMGLSPTQHQVRIEISPDEKNWRSLLEVNFSGFAGRKLNAQLRNTDVSDNGDLYLKVYSVSKMGTDWFSIAYFAVEYPKKLIYHAEHSQVFHFPSNSAANGTIGISDVPEDALVLDITEKYNVNKITGRPSEGGLRTFNLDIRARDLDMLIVPKEKYHTIEPGQIKKTDFSLIYSYNNTDINSVAPESFDYFIITAAHLKEGALEYAQYRASEAGGGYRVLLMDISTIYDLYNYGEPSALAIRAFMKHMLSKGIRPDKHNLLLIGAAVTRPMWVLKELPAEVPTIGDPAADMLIVAGLSGVHQDLPAIPVGRVKAFNSNEVIDYLNKVKEYESESSDIFWRKRALHISGGENSGEINTLRQILSNIKPAIEQTTFAGSVKSLVKTSEFIQSIDITKDINDGVGILTFFGHGAQTATDMNFGYVTDARRGYNNQRKYPFMYFNGCGVGNIFTSRSVHILTDNWLMTANKGSIAIIANSYKSYISPSARHITALYDVLFKDNSVGTIGGVWKKTAENIIASTHNEYDVANVHQVCLQGDPAIRIFRIEEPDYIVSKENIFVYGENRTKPLTESSKGQLAVIINNGGKYAENENIPLKIEYHYDDKATKESELTFRSVAFQDTIWLPIDEFDGHLTRIEVSIDPRHTLQEFTRSNNIADLVIDWDIIKPDHIFYPAEPLIDRIPPQVSAKFNGKDLPDKKSIPGNTSITVLLEDDQSMNEDKSRVEVYLKKCWDQFCDYFIQLNPDDYEITVVSGTRHLFSFQLPAGLEDGEYQILIRGRDESGNENGNGFVKNFRLSATPGNETTTFYRFIVSPNPATSYVKFSGIEEYFFENASLTWKIYNARGEKIAEKNQSLVNAFLNEWYFDFGNSGLPGGMYFYDILIEEKGALPAITQKGKFIILD